MERKAICYEFGHDGSKTTKREIGYMALKDGKIVWGPGMQWCQGRVMLDEKDQPVREDAGKSYFDLMIRTGNGYIGWEIEETDKLPGEKIKK